MKKPFDVTFKDISNLLCRTADCQQAGTYGTGAAAGKTLNVLQYSAVF